MKKYLKLLLTALIFAISFSACEKDDDDDDDNNQNNEPTEWVTVPTTKMAMVNKLTATWCGPCGTWGWELFEEIITDVDGKAIIMGTYGSSTDKHLFAQVAADFKKVFDEKAGWPAFCVNGVNETEYAAGGGIYTGQTRTNVSDAVDAFITGTASVNTGMEVSFDNDSIYVKTTTKFFEPGNGEYYLGLYIIEDGVVAYQSGIGNDAHHHYVLRTQFNNMTSWGVEIANGIVGKDTFFNKDYATVLPSGWATDHIKIAAVIWEKDGDNYSYVNGNISSL